MASTFWWASHMVARLLSTELSLFPLWATLLLTKWGSSGQGLAMAVDSLSPSALGGLQGRTVPLQVVLVPQGETLEVCAACKPPGIALAVLPWEFLAPPAEWQVCPPLGSAEADSASGLSRQSILPLSASGSCMPEHLMYYCHMVWAVLCPSALDPVEELYIHDSFHFSD